MKMKEVLRSPVEIISKVLGAVVQEATNINTKYTFAKEAVKSNEKEQEVRKFSAGVLCAVVM